MMYCRAARFEVDALTAHRSYSRVMRFLPKGKQSAIDHVRLCLLRFTIRQ
jgi:hypothetical protein